MTALEDFQKDAAKSFLNSVLIVDDRISFFESDININSGNIQIPDEFEKNEDIETSVAQINKATLNAQELIKSFCEKNIHCTPYKYETSFPYELAKKSDVLVLDWELPLCDARSILTELLDKQNHRMRFVCIYTNSPTEAIAQIEKLNFTDIELCEHENNSCRFNYRDKDSNKISCRILVISKNEVDEAKLALTVIDNFAGLCDGFIESILLIALSELREKSFNLMETYHKDLDLPSFTHFFNLYFSNETCREAQSLYLQFLLGLICDDINAIITNSDKIAKIATTNKILEPISCIDTLTFNDDEKRLKAEIGNLKNLFICDFSGTFAEHINKICNSFTPPLTKDNVKKIQLSHNKNLHLELSYINCTYKYYLHSEKMMKFGTIVKNIETDTFYICIMPLCDGLRLTDNQHNVPLLPLEEVNDEHFNYVVFENNKYLPLKVVKKPHLRIENYSFQVSKDTKTIISEENFFKIDGKNKFKWIAELKKCFVQDLLHKIAAEYSRIGMDQFEWLRKKSN